MDFGGPWWWALVGYLNGGGLWWTVVVGVGGLFEWWWTLVDRGGGHQCLSSSALSVGKYTQIALSAR
jgi:hypothetical protein